MKSKGLWAAMILAAVTWWACIIASAIFFGMGAAGLVIAAGLAVAVALKADEMMDEAGDDE